MTILPGSGVPEGWRPVQPAMPPTTPNAVPPPAVPPLALSPPALPHVDWTPRAVPTPATAPIPQPTSGPSLRPAGRKVTGGELLHVAWELVQRDRALLVLPVLAFLTSLAALSIVLTPIGLAAWHSGDVAAFAGTAHVVVGWLLLTLSTAITVYFQAALVVIVNAMLDGRTVTLGEALRTATSRLPQILLWAVIAATVGTLLRLVGERGVAGVIVRVLGGLAWAIASFFVVPILVVEQVSPFDALRRSTTLITHTWGKALRAGIRFGLVQIGVTLAIVAFFGLGVLVWPTSVALAMMMLVLAVVAMVAASVVFATLAQTLNTVLYRYAAGLPVPGIDQSLLAGAIATKR